MEQGNIAIGIYESGRLSWASNLLGMDPETLKAELPSLLLMAEVEGVPTAVQSVVLASDCADLHEHLREIFTVPIGSFLIEEVRPRQGVNLLPPDWAQAALKQERTERLRQRLLLAPFSTWYSWLARSSIWPGPNARSKSSISSWRGRSRR